MTDTRTFYGKESGSHHRLPALSSGRGFDAIFAKIPSLSSRELEVFYLLAGGASNRSISAALKVTERTAKAHVGRILFKLEVESRTQAGIAAFAWRFLANSDDQASIRAPSDDSSSTGAQPLAAGGQGHRN